MKKFGILALALTMFTGAATVSFAQATDSVKKTKKKRKSKKKSTAAKAT